MTLHASRMKRSDPVIGGLVYVGAPGQKQSDYREVSVCTGHDESRDSIVRGMVHRVIAAKQYRHDFSVSAP